MKKIIAILNHKGGVGKSTFSTNLSGCFANQGKNVMIGDFDVQQSSENWLTQRPKNLPPINAWQIKNGKLQTPDANIDVIIIDSPAGIRAASLKKLVSMSDKVIVPLRPGYFDILSTESFLHEIVDFINSQDKKIEICLVGNMVDHNTQATEQLRKFIQSCGLDNPTMIRQAQIYVHLSAHGLTIFDAKSDIFKNDIAEWTPLIQWLGESDEKLVEFEKNVEPENFVEFEVNDEIENNIESTEPIEFEVNDELKNDIKIE